MNKKLYLAMLKPIVKALHMMVDGIKDQMEKLDDDAAHDTAAEKIVKQLDSVLGSFEKILDILPL